MFIKNDGKELEGTDYRITDETKLVSNVQKGSASLFVMELEAADAWTLTVRGSIDGQFVTDETHVFEQEKETYRAYFQQVMNGFTLKKENEQTEELQKVNALAWWYTHNMLVHYSVPHGLEQYHNTLIFQMSHFSHLDMA